MNDSLIAVLKSIAAQERALAALAGAEAARLEALAAGLQTGTLPAWAGQISLETSAQGILHSATAMQLLLESKLAMLGTATQLPVSQSTSACRNISLLACGQGLLAQATDSYSGGLGTLKALHIVVRDSLVIEGDLCYQAENKRSRLSITALPGTLQVIFTAPGSTIVSGRALIKKVSSKKQRDQGCFTLTLITAPADITAHRFRMLVKADSKLALHHDSGLSPLTGIIHINHAAAGC